MQRTLKLRITTTRRQAITVAPQIVHTFCAVCNGEVPTLTCGQAAEFLEIGEQCLAELIAVGKVHATRTVSGTFRICQGSLISEQEDDRNSTRPECAAVKLIQG